MADITKCPGEYDGVICPIRSKCYRFTAPSTEYWQSFFVDMPGSYVTKDGDNLQWQCDMFWGDNQENIMKVFNDIFYTK